MTDYFVKPTNGLDTNAGTSLGAAFQTTQKAMDTAIAGDVVNLVNEATETTSVKIDLDLNNGTVTSPIIVQGVDTSGNLLAAGTRYSLQTSGTPANLLDFGDTVGGQYVYWQNIDFDGNDVNTADLLLMSVSGDADYNIFKDCRIQRSGADGADIRGIGAMFLGCEIDNNAGRGLAASAEANSRWGEASIIGCKVHDNGDDGLYVSSGVKALSGNICYGNSGSGIKLGNLTNTLRCSVIGNTCYNNTIDGIELQTASPNTLILINNTMVDNGGYGLNLLGTTKNMMGIDYNHYSGNTSGAVRHNGAAITEANVNSNGNIGANNQTGGSASSLFTSITGGSEDFTPKNGVVLDGNGLNSGDIGALPAADAAGGGGGAIVNQGLHAIDSGIMA